MRNFREHHEAADAWAEKRTRGDRKNCEGEEGEWQEVQRICWVFGTEAFGRVDLVQVCG